MTKSGRFEQRKFLAQAWQRYQSSNKLEPKNFKLGITNCILIGPEGDFSPSERELILKKSNVVPFSLSKNILRTDTAVISAISLINFINNNH